MWISIITINLVSFRNSGTDTVGPIIESIYQKKDELKEIDGAGNSLPGYSPDDISDLFSEELLTAEIRRAWNTQAAAEEFANFVNSTADFITVAVEEQA